MQLPVTVFDAGILVDGKGLPWFEVEPLTVLDVSQNLLQQLPSEIRQLECLKVLNISSNELESLPEALRDLSALKLLDASCNRCENSSLWDVSFRASQHIHTWSWSRVDAPCSMKQTHSRMLSQVACCQSVDIARNTDALYTIVKKGSCSLHTRGCECL